MPEPEALRVEIAHIRQRMKDVQFALGTVEACSQSAKPKEGLDELFGWSKTMAMATRGDRYGLSQVYIRIHRAAARSKGVDALL